MNTFIGIICVPLYVYLKQNIRTVAMYGISTLHSESSTDLFILSINFLVYDSDKHIAAKYRFYFMKNARNFSLL